MIQIDIDMPKSCAVCRFNSRCDDCECLPNFCMASPVEDDCHACIGYFKDGSHEYDPEIGFTPEYSRMEWCPLKEEKHGHWEELRPYDVRCSVCGNSMMDKYPFCPECGARMGG